MRTVSARQGLFVATAVISLCQCGWAAAQSAAPPTDGAAKLDEIVVVARRTEERLQDVPISVTAITPQALRQTSITTGTDLIKLVPTLNVQQDAITPDPAYSLRGIRTGVITYLNEVPTATAAVDDQIWDLSSVQALAGPQGTLFGRNSTGGAILFVPQRPGAAFGGYIEGGLGDYDWRQTTAVLNLPISDKLKVRLGARLVRRDPVVDNQIGPGFQSRHRDIYRASVLFQPTASVSNYTVVDYAKRDEQPVALITSQVLPTSGCFPGLGCLYGDQPVRLGTAQDQLGIRTIRSSFPAYERGEGYGVSNILAVAPSNSLTLKYVLGYRHRSYDQFFSKTSLNLPIQVGRNSLDDQTDWTHEVQALGKTFDGKLSWTVGAFYLNSKSDPHADYSIFGAAGLPFDSGRNILVQAQNARKSAAAYAQGTLALTGKLNLTAGVRYTKDTASIRLRSLSPVFTFFGPQICSLPMGGPGVDFANCVANVSSSSNATTYNLSVDYHLSPDVLAYATTRRGYNGGGFNQGVPATNDPGAPQPAYQPETIVDYEAGLKADWRIAGAPLRTNISTFIAKYRDIQRTIVGVSTSGQAYSGLSNGPRATIYGMQFESVVKPTPNLTLNANYGYLHSQYDQGAPGFPKGNRFAQAPTHSVNLSAVYQHPVPAGGDVTASLSYTYQSTVTFQDANEGASFALQKGYGIADARLSWDSVADRPIDVSLFVKNLTDEAYALERQDILNVFGFVGSVYNDPRSYGVELRYRFGAS